MGVAGAAKRRFGPECGGVMVRFGFMFQMSEVLEDASLRLL
jgi:hypothetical protein